MSATPLNTGSVGPKAPALWIGSTRGGASGVSAGGVLTYKVTGLSFSQRYDVQVGAVVAGSTSWSASVGGISGNGRPTSLVVTGPEGQSLSEYLSPEYRTVNHQVFNVPRNIDRFWITATTLGGGEFGLSASILDFSTTFAKAASGESYGPLIITDAVWILFVGATTIHGGLLLPSAVTIVPTGELGAPTRPLSSVGLSARVSSLRVVWSAAPPSDLAESYEVAWRSSDPDAEGPELAGAWRDASGSDADCAVGDDPGPADDCGEDVGSALAYTISGLSSGSGYDVRVRSRNSAGNGPWSSLRGAVVDGSGDSTLSSLSLWDASPGGGVLSFSPVFSPEVLSYSASVAHSVSRVVVVPVSSASGAGISVSVGVLPRAPVSSGSRSVVGGVAAGGVLRFVLSVSSSDGSVASSYALSVSRARAPLLFDSVLSSRRVHVSGGALSLLLPGARGGLGLLSYSVSGAPSGLSFSSSDRRLSGLLSPPLSPVSPLSSVLTYSVSDSVSPVLRSSQTFTLTMSPSPSFSPPVPSVLSLRFNMSASETFPSLSGGFSPYAYSLLGEMPPGLSFDASTRVFSGVPGVSGTFLLAYHALDVLGSSEGLSSGVCLLLCRCALRRCCPLLRLA